MFFEYPVKLGYFLLPTTVSTTTCPINSSAKPALQGSIEDA